MVRYLITLSWDEQVFKAAMVKEEMKQMLRLRKINAGFTARHFNNAN